MPVDVVVKVCEERVEKRHDLRRLQAEGKPSSSQGVSEPLCALQSLPLPLQSALCVMIRPKPHRRDAAHLGEGDEIRKEKGQVIVRISDELSVPPSLHARDDLAGEHAAEQHRLGVELHGVVELQLQRDAREEVFALRGREDVVVDGGRDAVYKRVGERAEEDDREVHWRVRPAEERDDLRRRGAAG